MDNSERMVANSKIAYDYLYAIGKSGLFKPEACLELAKAVKNLCSTRCVDMVELGESDLIFQYGKCNVTLSADFYSITLWRHDREWLAVNRFGSVLCYSKEIEDKVKALPSM